MVPYLICCTSTESFCGLGTFLLPVFICFCIVLITAVYVYFKTKAESVFPTHPQGWNTQLLLPCSRDREQNHKTVSYYRPNRKSIIGKARMQGSRIPAFCVHSLFFIPWLLYTAQFPSGKSRHEPYLWKPQNNNNKWSWNVLVMLWIPMQQLCLVLHPTEPKQKTQQ